MNTKLYNEITRLKKSLTEKAKKNGIYENFGQKEVRMLYDKYETTGCAHSSNRQLINSFDEWCMNFDLRMI